MPLLPSDFRLLQVVHGLYPQAIGGVELYTWELARALGGAVLSMTPRVDGSPVADGSEWAGLNVYTREPSESAEHAWHRTLDEVRPEVVLVQHLGPLEPEALLALRERGTPYAVFLHDFTAVCPTHKLWHRSDQHCSGPAALKCALCVAGTLRRGIEIPVRAFRYLHRPEAWQVALTGAEALIANSRFLRDFIVEQGAPPERVAVISPCVADGDAFGPLRFGARPRSLLYAGGWSVAKGSDLLAHAAAEVDEPFEIHITSPADSATEQHFREAIPPRHAIRFYGALAPPAMRAVLRACGAAIVPSRWNETYSRIAGEAFGAGVPVVATAVGAMPERVIHGVNGYLGNPTDPKSLAQAIEEALAPGTAWDPLAARDHYLAETSADLQTLAALLERVRQRADFPVIDIEFRQALSAISTADGGKDLRERLISALREGTDEQSGDAHNGASYAVAVLARSRTRTRRAHLNHALAYFRAAGCRRVLHVNSGIADAAAWFSSWGLETRTHEPVALLQTLAAKIHPNIQPAAADYVPDGLFIDTRDRNVRLHELRDRYPLAKAVLFESESGIEAA